MQHSIHTNKSQILDAMVGFVVQLAIFDGVFRIRKVIFLLVMTIVLNVCHRR